MIRDWTLEGGEHFPEIMLERAGCEKCSIEGELLGFSARQSSLIVLAHRKDRPMNVPLEDVAKMTIRIGTESRWTIVNDEKVPAGARRPMSKKWTMTEMERTIESGPGL